MTSVRSFSCPEQVGNILDTLVSQSGTDVSKFLVKLILREESRLKIQSISEDLDTQFKIESHVERANRVTDHVMMKPEVLELVEAQFNPKIEVKTKSNEKVGCCVGVIHDRGLPIEVDGEIIGVPCKNCHNIMEVNPEKLSEWKKSQGMIEKDAKNARGCEFFNIS